MTVPADSRRSVSGRVILLLATLLIANPVVLFLLAGSIALAAGVCLAVVMLAQASYAVFGSRLPTVYLLNCLAVGSVFMHGEVLMNFRFSDYVIEDLYWIRDGYYFNRPVLRTRITGKEFAADYLTNVDGFRIGYSQQTSVTYDTVDWLFIGDSYTQGAQVQFEQLYTTLLYRMFPERIVANAGISGFGIPDEYEFFRHRGRTLKPTIVFLQVSSFNDFMKVQSKEVALSDYLVQYSTFIRFLLQDIKYQNPAELPLGRWTEPFYPEERSNRAFNVFYNGTSPEKERDLASYGRYLRLLNDEVRRAGARLVVLLLPTKEQVRPRYLEEIVRAFKIDPAMLDMQRPNRLVRAVTDSLGIELIDLLDPFQWAAEEAYFEYDEHLTPFGHQLLAQTIATRLKGRGERDSTRILSRSYAGDRYPTYVSQGSQILFQSPSDGNMELYLADSAFVSARRLTFNDVDDFHPAMTTDGRRIALTRGSQEEGTTKVVITALDGSAPIQLPAESSAYGAIPSFSPDGQRVAYARWAVNGRSGSLSPSRIVIADLRSGETRDMAGDEREAWRPVYSPDGRSLAYIAKVDGQFDLFVRDLLSGDERRLTSTSYDEWDPRFSYAGDRLVYAARQDGNWDLFILDLRSGRRRRLTNTRGNEWDPAFAPDDRRVVYAGEYGTFRGIYVVDSGVRR